MGTNDKKESRKLESNCVGIGGRGVFGYQVPTPLNAGSGLEDNEYYYNINILLNESSE